jgi:hypothetical protein
VTGRSLQCVLALVLAAAGPAVAEVFSPGFAGFSVRVRGEVNPYEVLGVYVLPGESLDLEILDTDSPESFQLGPTQGQLLTTGKGNRSWKAPPTLREWH